MDGRALGLVTWNVWFDRRERSRRRRALWREIEALDPDVICLQEATPEHVEGPEVAAARARGYWISDAALVDYDVVTLARLPARERVRVPLPSMMGRSLLVTRLAVDPPLTIATVHLESTAAMTELRVRQLELICEALADEPCVALVGDMNFPPGDRPEAAPLVGWRDAWAELRPDEPGYTVDSHVNEMRFVSTGRHKQVRIDRVFLRGDGWRVASIERLGVTALPDDPLTFPSDHFGLYAELQPTR
ncbi:MAG: endonuclease/exonuclease/phosphatase family protein [Myxococcales bacterium]|nr:endonuclease/exonuclease/phosphatase family protein [Myxococcales bacterium]